MVVGVTSQDIDDIYTIRTRIEGLAARRCAQNIGDDELEELRQVVELQEYFVTKQDFLQVWHLDSRFHEMVYDACRSRPLKQILSLFHDDISESERIFGEVRRARGLRPGAPGHSERH